MKICIYGCGVVGEAYAKAYEAIGHKVFRHDISLGTNVHQVVEFGPEIVYICLPTPMKEDGSCDISIIDNELQILFDIIKYHNTDPSFVNPCVVIKSTVAPGTCDFFVEKYSINTEYFGHCPEYLRERSAEIDAKNQKILAIGTYGDTICRRKILESNEGLHNSDPLFLVPTESELAKYFHNCFNAIRISVASEFYSLCEKLGVSYTLVKNTMLKSNGLPNEYLSFNSETKSYGGPCLPKDMNAISCVLKENDLSSFMIDASLATNDLFEITVFEGMRS